MSLHAKISPQAQAALDAQKRNSTVTSIIIALLTMLLLCLALMFFLLKTAVEKTDPLHGYGVTAKTDPPITPPNTPNSVQRKPPSASHNMSKIINANTTSPISMPTIDIQVTEPSLQHGSGSDFGEGFMGGDGNGNGGFNDIPDDFKKRCSKADRLERLSKQGGTPECEDAVVASLRWLQKTQNQDGSWTNKKVSMTSLALLAYLGHCETPNSAEFGQTVTDAITYLVAIGIKNNGSLADNFQDKHWPYEHAIATYALAEAYTFCSKQNINIPNLKKTVQLAGNHILLSQHTSGGWDYSYDQSGTRGGDSSIVAWHLQALKACKLTGLEFQNLKRVANKGLQYLETCQKENGGIYYRPNSGSIPSMTGAGMLCYQQWGKSSRSLVKKAAKFARNISFHYNQPSADLYAHYYYGQALINQGGTHWQTYNQKFRDQILNAQNQDGSYKAPGGGQKLNAVAPTYQTGPYALHYRTCLNTLMLEVYYRFLLSASTR